MYILVSYNQSNEKGFPTFPVDQCMEIFQFITNIYLEIMYRNGISHEWNVR